MTLSVQTMGTTPGIATDDGRHKKLKDAAQQFEAMLLQEMLKPVREQGMFTLAGNDDERSSDAMSSFGTASFAGAIARSGGMGIANSVLRQVEREDASRTSTAK